MKVLQLTAKQRAAALADDADSERTGIFTSGIVATKAANQIALFFTGVRHAGENLTAVLARRNTDLPAPIQMCDGLSRNIPTEFDTILSQCLAHARRRYVELTESFPAEVRFVLETLREVYITDARAREQNLDPAQRLALHQAESTAPMKALEHWMQRQFTDRLIEPNSALGAAILYMQKRWSELTLFLRAEGAPLDNNSSHAASGIRGVMPLSGLCRDICLGRLDSMLWELQSRHNFGGFFGLAIPPATENSHDYRSIGKRQALGPAQCSRRRFPGPAASGRLRRSDASQEADDRQSFRTLDERPADHLGLFG